MIARVNSAQMEADKLAGLIEFSEERFPDAREARGFKGFYLLADRQSGKVVSISLWDSDDDLEAKAFAGQVPWIDDPCGDNATSLGIPRSLVLSPRLAELFQDTFGPGRADPLARPGLQTWAEVLRQAADLTVVCPACGSSFYVNVKPRPCSWCDANDTMPALLYVEVRLWETPSACAVYRPGTD